MLKFISLLYFQFSEQYGNVYGLFWGSKPAVVLNGFAVIKEALVTKAGDFSGRPQDFMTNHMTENKGVILADYGPGWKEHRRFALMTLRNFGLGKQSMEERILKEISHIVACLDQNAGGIMTPQTLFHNAASNVISLVLFGTRFDYKDEFLKRYVQLSTEISKIVNGPWNMIYDTFPALRHMPLPFKKGFEVMGEMKNMTLNLINEHKMTRVPGEPRDFIDCYMEELDKRGNDGSSFDKARLSMFIVDLHFAGTDTTSNTLLTAFLYLMNHPDVQSLYFNNTYITLTIVIILLCMSLTQINVYLSFFQRDVSERLMMFWKGTLIIPNLTSVLNEEGQWKFPHEFNPDNFLNDQDQFEKPEAFMPFSTGPRVCLGEALARMELFLILVTLLRRFQFVWPEDAGKPDYTPLFGVTQTPKPYRMHIKLREIAK
ncbi:cytochrome P450 2D3-like isoform X5 [Triplophysa dalaica]|uniref:cytochrome P450 2D3-like isoform X5 n=1 Tax=Triplophysa dalaica TaxID=1582913 RepID=UPI0024E00F55|nr:cytochrome P450 2D3-like isoform X5 [Triplophysa dalaica]